MTPAKTTKVIDTPKTAREKLAAYLYNKGLYNLSELVHRDMYVNIFVDAIMKDMVARKRSDGTPIDDSLLAQIDSYVVVNNATPKIPTSKRVRAKKTK